MPRILVVDDDPHIRELVSVFLEQEGFQTYEAIDGMDALRKIEEVEMDMVILDIMMPNGGAITIKLIQNDEQAEVHIRDTGIGISAEQREYIFERFYKADSSRNRTYGGSGLGLAIVKKVIDLHQGEIQVESVVGNGTEFIISIPNSKLIN